MNVSSEDLDEIVCWAQQQPEIIQVYLFGSRARGDHRPDSDIDLAIRMKASRRSSAFATWMFWKERFDRNPDLELEHSVDLQWYEPNAGLEYVGPGVERDGILIYDREIADGSD